MIYDYRSGSVISAHDVRANRTEDMEYCAFISSTDFQN